MSQPRKLSKRRRKALRNSKRQRRNRNSNLHFEQLESRQLLATVAWDGGGADANWTTAENWAGDVAPSANDDLVFSVGAV